MFIQGTGIVLGQYGYLPNVGIGHVAEREINCPVASRNRHSRYGTPVGKIFHPMIVASCQNNTCCFHIRSPAFIKVSPLTSLPSE